MLQRAPKLSPVWGFVRDIALGVVIWLLITATIGEARVVPSVSMAPTIHVGDRLWTDKLTLHWRPIRRGDIVVFDTPFPATTPYVKRVIGLSGETVEVKDGKVLINGRPIDEPYLAEKPAYHFGPITVPQGQVLVLGDNRNDSYDSHYWGCLDKSAITARVVFRFWPLEHFGPVR